MLMKETEENTNSWKDIQCPWTEKINIVQNDSPTQGSLQAQYNPYQFTNGIFHRTRTKNFKTSENTKNSEQSKKS